MMTLVFLNAVLITVLVVGAVVAYFGARHILKRLDAALAKADTLAHKFEEALGRVDSQDKRLTELASAVQLSKRSK